jgi:hypothetical protein
MRKLITLAIAATAALAVAAPGAVAQGGPVYLQSSTGTASATGEFAFKVDDPSAGLTTVRECGFEATAHQQDEAGAAAFFDIYFPNLEGSWGCGYSSYLAPCDESWPIQFSATGLAAPEFRASVELCMNSYGVYYRGTVTGDVQTDGSTITALEFDDAPFENQTPPAGTGGFVQAAVLDGSIDFENTMTIEAVEE